MTSMTRLLVALAWIVLPLEAIAVTLIEADNRPNLLEPSELIDTQSTKAAITNPKRAYPPSCLTLPLPTNPSGPSLFGTVAFREVGTEALRPVNVEIWRVPCSASKGALLVTMQGAPLDFLSVPLFLGEQDGQPIAFRLVTEPNTQVQGTTTTIIPPSGVATFVLDIAEATSFAPDLNRLFTITAGYPDPVQSTTVISSTAVPAYSAAAYPPLGNRPFTGYLTGSYYDPTKPGEGMLLEVAEAGTQLLFVVSWYTFDDEGFPLWFVGANVFNEGATSVTVELESKFGGRLGGNFDPNELINLPFGTATFTFPNCGTMQFTYQSTHSLDGFPMGTGSRTWTRLSSVAGNACD